MLHTLLKKMFVLNFSNSSIALDASNMHPEFYDFDCKDGGIDFTEFKIPSGITGPNGTSPAEMTNGADC